MRDKVRSACLRPPNQEPEWGSLEDLFLAETFLQVAFFSDVSGLGTRSDTCS